VVKIIYALRPSLRSKLLAIAGVGTRFTWDATRRSLRLLSDVVDKDAVTEQNGFLRTMGRAAQATMDSGALMERVEQLFAAKKDALDLVHDREVERLGWWGELMSRALRGKPHEIAWAGVKELVSDSTFEIRRADADYERIDALAAPDYDFVIAGHTHLARILERKNRRGMYYNTGTWAALMRLKASDIETAEKFEPVFERLKSATDIAALGDDVFTRPTVATIQSRGGQLQFGLRNVTLKDGNIVLGEAGDER
jgi:hypothetical protein